MSENKKLLVVIDPGHTGNTYNAGAVKGYYESKAVYDLSLYEKTALEKRGMSSSRPTKNRRLVLCAVLPGRQSAVIRCRSRSM